MALATLGLPLILWRLSSRKRLLGRCLGRRLLRLRICWGLLRRCVRRCLLRLCICGGLLRRCVCRRWLRCLWRRLAELQPRLSKVRAVEAWIAGMCGEGLRK